MRLVKWRLPPPTIAKFGEQLELGLFLDEPWEGRSPRVLTRGHLGLIFNPRGEKSAGDFVNPAQLEFWPVGRSARNKIRGPAKRGPFPSAPTLLSLPFTRPKGGT